MKSVKYGEVHAGITRIPGGIVIDDDEVPRYGVVFVEHVFEDALDVSHRQRESRRAPNRAQ